MSANSSKSQSMVAVSSHTTFFTSNFICYPKSWEIYVFQEFLVAGISGCLTVQLELNCNISSRITRLRHAEVVSKWPKSKGTQLTLYLWSECNPPRSLQDLLHLHGDMEELNWCYTAVGWHKWCYSYGHVWAACFRLTFKSFIGKFPKCSFKISVTMCKTLNRNCYACMSTAVWSK